MQAAFSKYQNVDGYRDSVGAPLTTSGICMKQMPKTRQYELLEFLRPGLGAVTFGDLNQTELSVVIWLLAGVRPNSATHD